MGAARAAASKPLGLSELLEEFLPFLDESLILAIVGDYDLEEKAEDARSTLRQLADEAANEELLGFNPSGVAPAVQSDMTCVEPEAPGSTVFTDGDDSRPISSITSDSSPDTGPLALSDDFELGAIAEDDKEPTLVDMFPEMKPFDISLELKRAKGDFDKALVALLTRQCLEEAGELQRGTIEGAFTPEFGGRKKGKNKKKGGSSAAGTKSNLRLDVEYRLKPLSLDDTDELAGANQSPVRSPPFSPPRSGTASPARRYTAPITDSPAAAPEKLSTWQTVSARKTTSSKSGMVSPPFSDSSSASLRAAAGHSFDQAQNAWRRGRSDPLFRTAAVVYAERGHSQVDVAKTLERADYEAIVDRQSSARLIDLHGVPVREGVEIALNRTLRWWRTLGETEEHGARVAARREPFMVVTGTGRHSVGGVSRLRQMVGVALARDGWTVEAQTAKFVITGRKT